jgi:5-bromo-4-chloroindolyl phosphate hydrolysis protein
MNQKFIKLTAISCLLGASTLLANPAKFAKKKEFMLNHLDKKIELISRFKSCINNTTKNSELKSCRQTYKASMKELRVKAKAKRAEFKAEKHK